MSAEPPRNDLQSEPDVEHPKRGEWTRWSPSPKMQIVLIAAAFGLFNFLLLAIWAIVMIKQF